MRFRNFIPLILLLLFTAIPGLAFLYFWENHALVMLGMQFFYSLLMILTYRGGINSAKKNTDKPFDPGKIVYLSLKINQVLYFIVGIPTILIFAGKAAVLMMLFGVGTLGFALAYLSGITYIARSLPPQ